MCVSVCLCFCNCEYTIIYISAVLNKIVVEPIFCKDRNEQATKLFAVVVAFCFLSVFNYPLGIQRTYISENPFSPSISKI